MNRSQLLPVLIALLAIASLSIASTTLETSLTTDPDDEINPDWDTLPIGESDAAEIQESIEGDGEETGDGAGGGSAEATGSAGEEPSLLDRLIALLSVLLPVVAILTLAVLAYRYREVLAGFLGRDSETDPAPQHRSAAGRWPGTPPENDVDRAWVEVIRRLNPERPETMTPDECRALARVRDVDRDAVESIVTAFERVHYGGSSVDAETDRARDGLSALEVRVK